MRPAVCTILLVLLLATGAHAGAKKAARAVSANAGECLAKLEAAASSCSATLNGANKVAYQRLDRVFGARGNSAFRLDTGRFFHMAVGFSQDSVKAPEDCCRAAAEVFTPAFQQQCACIPEVARHTRAIDKELMDYYFEFLKGSCAMDTSKVVPWSACGVSAEGFVVKATESIFTAKEAVAGAIANAAGAAAGAAAGKVETVSSVAGAAAGLAAGKLGGRRRLLMAEGNEGGLGGGEGPDGGDGGDMDNTKAAASSDGGGGQCAAAGSGTQVAQNTAAAAFYFLCPANTGHCGAGGKCVYGRTRAVAKGEWATCEPLTNCGAELAVPGHSGCFPAAATVRLPGGAAKRMDELRVGDKVLAAAPDGTLEFQDVYFFGHRDAAAAAPFVRLGLAGGRALELTPDHFVPVVAAEGAATEGAAAALEGARMTYARDVAVGDVLLITADDGGEGLVRAAVESKAAVTRSGLFNPYTMGGTIVVDGVLASAHSGWLIDGAFARLGLSHAVPAALQAALAPLRVLYAAAGPRFMQVFGDALASAALRFEAALLGASASAAAAPAAPAAAAVAAAVIAGAASAALARRQVRA